MYKSKKEIQSDSDSALSEKISNCITDYYPHRYHQYATFWRYILDWTLDPQVRCASYIDKSKRLIQDHFEGFTNSGVNLSGKGIANVVIEHYKEIPEYIDKQAMEGLSNRLQASILPEIKKDLDITLSLGLTRLNFHVPEEKDAFVKLINEEILKETTKQINKLLLKLGDIRRADAEKERKRKTDKIIQWATILTSVTALLVSIFK